MNPVYIEAVSILGPGFPDWESAQEIFCDRNEYNPEPTSTVNCSYLSANVKRRTTLHMQVALHAAEKALQQVNMNGADVELVFASNEGDLGIADEIFLALTEPEKIVSPQKFQNVILNAAIGHLGIILGNQHSATCVSGGEYSFAVGLLQAATSAVIENHPVLFVCYDALGPSRLDPRHVSEPCSVAVLLSPSKSDYSLASMVPALSGDLRESVMTTDKLEKTRVSIGAARALPLLAAIARESNETVAMPYCEKSILGVEISICKR